jgi:alkanesulfonate monooxygenase SsuD/methylene tetrahydromethanopterin reductase-like flavin-dependent oxidoreductase (luciferase family)
MQIGCHLPTQGAVATREALVTFARQAEEYRMASLWVSDHVVFPRMGNSNYPSGRFPPLWVGAVALGDGWHASAQSPTQMRQHLEHLRQAADTAGRPFETLELSLRLKLSAEAIEGSRQAIIDEYCAYKQLGLSHLAVDFRREDLSEMLETLDVLATEICPAVQAA